jgi:gamma-glutamyltranspeptidase/glutathione hydrolase
MNFRENAPNAATENIYLDVHGNVIPHVSTVDYAAIVGPGTMARLVNFERRSGN